MAGVGASQIRGTNRKNDTVLLGHSERPLEGTLAPLLVVFAQAKCQEEALRGDELKSQPKAQAVGGSLLSRRFQIERRIKRQSLAFGRDVSPLLAI